MKHKKWHCPKCDNKDFEVSQFSAAGGLLTRFFNIQSKSFTTVTCARCAFTEIYRTESSKLSNVLDFFGN